jgi:hypothetical protein
VAVVLSDDSAPYQEVFQVIRAHLDDSGHSAAPSYAANPDKLDAARLVVAVGVRAAEVVGASASRAPVLAVLVPRVWFLRTGRALLTEDGRRSASAIFIDQPFERQAALIRLAFPDARRVGVLVTRDHAATLDELEPALRNAQLALVPARVDAGERLIAPLENVLREADVLLALPDPQVFNRNTAQSLFLTSYRYRDPVVGYSRSLTRAGALLSLHSSPAQIGRQAAEWIRQALSGGAVRLPAAAYPAYFSVSINDQVGRSLGYTLPPAETLEAGLGATR